MTHILCSVGFNGITGDGAESLANAVLEHTTLTDFCSIPLVSLRENTITELNLSSKGVGVPGAIVLSSLLPLATALKSLEYASFQLFALSLPSAPSDASIRLSFAAWSGTLWELRERPTWQRPSRSTTRLQASSTLPHALFPTVRAR